MTNYHFWSWQFIVKLLLLAVPENKCLVLSKFTGAVYTELHEDLGSFLNLRHAFLPPTVGKLYFVMKLFWRLKGRGDVFPSAFLFIYFFLLTVFDRGTDLLCLSQGGVTVSRRQSTEWLSMQYFMFCLKIIFTVSTVCHSLQASKAIIYIFNQYPPPQEP